MNDGMAQILSSALEPWMQELSRTLHVAQVECTEPVTSVVLCGGGARMKGIEGFMARNLDLEVRNLELPLLKEKKVTWDSAWSQALGLALKGGGVRQASRVNFRKGEFGYRGEIEQSRKKARWIWIALFLIIVLGAADLALKYRIRTSRYNEVKAELRQMYREMFPESKAIVDEVYQAQTAVEELKKKAKLFGQKQQSALVILGELAVRIPKEIQIEVRELVIEPDRVRFEAETESFKSVDRIKAAVIQSKLFQEGVVSNAKISAKKGKVKFDLTLRLANREEGG